MLLFPQVEDAIMNSLGRYLSLNIIFAPTRWATNQHKKGWEERAFSLESLSPSITFFENFWLWRSKVVSTLACRKAGPWFESRTGTLGGRKQELQPG